MIIDLEKIKKAAQLSVDRPFSIPEAGEDDRRYAGDEIAWLDFVGLATPAVVLELIAEVDRLKSEIGCATGDIRTAVQIIERNQKDSDRYRWLRSNQFDALDIMESSGADQMQYKNSDELDAAIDAAISNEVQS